MLLGFAALECYVNTTAMWVFSLVPAMGLASPSPLLPLSGYAAWLAHTHRLPVCSNLLQELALLAELTLRIPVTMNFPLQVSHPSR